MNTEERVSFEDQEALKQKLSQMSPEELKEFQKQQCIFCQIVSGKVQSKKVFEDEKAVCILDINPANPGHVLLLPKEHYAIMQQLPDEYVSHMFRLAKKVSHALLQVLKAAGTTVFVANGVAAGQRAQHFMIHIIPRVDNDNLGIGIPKNEQEDIGELATEIRDKLDVILGKKKAQVETKPVQSQSTKPPVIEADFSEDIDEEIHDKEDKQDKEDDTDDLDALSSGQFVASKITKKYHDPSCRIGRMIEPENRVILTDPEEQGYTMCKKCMGKPKQSHQARADTKKESKKEEERVDLDDIASLLG